jgi:hypothetical protein
LKTKAVNTVGASNIFTGLLISITPEPLPRRENLTDPKELR